MKEKKIEGMAGSDDERQCTKSLPLTVELVSESGEKVTEQEGISIECFPTVHASYRPSLKMSREGPRSKLNMPGSRAMYRGREARALYVKPPPPPVETMPD